MLPAFKNYNYSSSVSDFSHTILISIPIQAIQASRWLIFGQLVLLRLLSYGNENDYDKHLRSRTELLLQKVQNSDLKDKL